MVVMVRITNLRRLLTFLGTHERYSLFLDAVQRSILELPAKERSTANDATLLPMRQRFVKLWDGEELTPQDCAEMTAWLLGVEEAARELGPPYELIVEGLGTTRSLLRLTAFIVGQPPQDTTPAVSPSDTPSVPVVDLVRILSAPTTVECPYCHNQEEPVPLAFHCYPVAAFKSLPLKDTAVCPSCDQSFTVAYTPLKGGNIFTLDEP